ncbi:MAG: GTP-binding protein HSR1, partial [Actinomycetota bacterium]|nr:GTP-binding protein HSR1 [Actinomycetota bacterium]
TDRLTADVRTTATALTAHRGADGGPGVGRLEREQLTDALAEAAGVPAVTAAVERSVRRSGTATTGWPLLRWTRNLRADPLDRLHLGAAQDGADEGTVPARTSLPAAGAVQRAGVARAVRAAREAAGEGLPEAWRDELRRTVEVSEEQLADRLDRAIAGTDLGPLRAPMWQRAVGGLQWLLTLVALVGALWLLALVVLGFFQLDEIVPLPRVEGLPLPTLLLVGGLLAGVLLALVARPLVGLRARRRARRAEQRMRAAVDVVAQEEVLAPMAEVREDHDRYCAAVTRAGK